MIDNPESARTSPDYGEELRNIRVYLADVAEASNDLVLLFTSQDLHRTVLAGLALAGLVMHNYIPEKHPGNPDRQDAYLAYRAVSLADRLMAALHPAAGEKGA